MMINIQINLRKHIKKFFKIILRIKKSDRKG